jgi:hypothetical protein
MADRAEDPLTGRCANCGALLAGPFCHACGQEASRRLDSLATFLRHGVSGLLHLDGLTLRSVRDLLFRPGKLTTDFLGEHRVRYLQPVQLYLLAAALFFLVNSYHPFLVVDAAHHAIHSSLGAMATGGSIDEAQVEALAARGISPALFAERFRTTAGSLLPLFLIGAVVLFAVAIAAFEPRSPKPLLGAAIFALHWTAFYLLLMIVERLPGGPPGSRPRVSGLLSAVALVYLVAALRRVYGQAWPWTVLKGLGLFLVFNVFLALWASAVILYAFHTI